MTTKRITRQRAKTKIKCYPNRVTEPNEPSTAHGLSWNDGRSSGGDLKLTAKRDGCFESTAGSVQGNIAFSVRARRACQILRTLNQQVDDLGERYCRVDILKKQKSKALFTIYGGLASEIGCRLS